jgi:hypothetical protein
MNKVSNIYYIKHAKSNKKSEVFWEISIKMEMVFLIVDSNRQRRML